MDPRLLHDIAFWLLVGGGGVILALVLLSGAFGRLPHHYRRHFVESRRERHFIASVTFFVTFAIVRIITHSIRAGRGPFHNIESGGRHIHHLVFGILILLIVGFIWLSQFGTGMGRCSLWAGRLTAFLFAVGAALTLDEFALWFNLADVYWSPEGVASVRAVFLFGAALSVGFWGGPFLRALARDLVHGFRRLE